MTISIGPVEFQRFEVPSVIHYGGAQRIATHYLADGRRSYDLLGPEEFNIQFAGVLAGTTAVPRSRELEEIRRNGRQTTLRWGGFAIPIVLSQLTLEYHNDSWIHYSVSCFVVDETVEIVAGITNFNAVPTNTMFQILDLGKDPDTSTLNTLVNEAKAALASGSTRASRLDLDARLGAADLALAKSIADTEQTIVQDNIVAGEDQPLQEPARTLANLTRARAVLGSLRVQLRAQGVA